MEWTNTHNMREERILQKLNNRVLNDRKNFKEYQERLQRCQKVLKKFQSIEDNRKIIGQTMHHIRGGCEKSL